MVRNIARDKSAGSDLRIAEIVSRFKGSLRCPVSDTVKLLTAQWRDEPDTLRTLGCDISDESDESEICRIGRIGTHGKNTRSC